MSESGLKQLSKIVDKQRLDINIKIGDMLELPYENKTFDCVVAFHSIYHTDYNGLKK